MNHHEEIRRLVKQAPDEPTYCEFKRDLGYETKREKGELVKDVSSFANIDLEALGGYGYLIFGVAPDGEVVGVGDLSGDPPSELRKAINGFLGRSILFEYLTCEVQKRGGETTRLPVIVVPDSKRRPHVVSRNITEQQNKKDKLWLREGEVWIRKTGGRELATADDLDAMYEGKLRQLVEDRVRPLEDTVARLEEDLRIRSETVPKIGFGFSMSGEREPLVQTSPLPVLGTLFEAVNIRKELEWAKERSSQSGASRSGEALGLPTSEDYDFYHHEMEAWREKLEGLLLVEVVLTNTGRALAEDVEVTVKVPYELEPSAELPEKPKRPRPIVSAASDYVVPTLHPSKQSDPESLLGPYVTINRTSSEAYAVWEVGKLFHGRPLFSNSDQEDVDGLLISAKGYQQLLAEQEGGIELRYEVRAANLPEVLDGTLLLR